MRLPVLYAPHVALAIGYAAWAHGSIDETAWLTIVALAHVAAPICAAMVADRLRPWPTFWRGPAVLLGAHAVAIAVWLWALRDGPPEGTWLALMLLLAWAIALALYTAYCVSVFGALARLRR